LTSARKLLTLKSRAAKRAQMKKQGRGQRRRVRTAMQKVWGRKLVMKTWETRRVRGRKLIVKTWETRRVRGRRKLIVKTWETRRVRGRRKLGVKTKEARTVRGNKESLGKKKACSKDEECQEKKKVLSEDGENTGKIDVESDSDVDTKDDLPPYPFQGVSTPSITSGASKKMVKKSPQKRLLAHSCADLSDEDSPITKRPRLTAYSPRKQGKDTVR
jgi:hypothetical protein